MSTHFQYSDAEFSARFRDCTLEPDLFSHEAHLRLAWIYLNAHGIDTVIQYCLGQIQRFDQVYGDGRKFHATLTVAAVKALAHFKSRSRSHSFPDFLAEFPRLKTDFRGLLAQHYSFDVLGHPIARRQYVQPDRLAF